jgi:hemolysin activation/secretion protein
MGVRFGFWLAVCALCVGAPLATHAQAPAAPLVPQGSPLPGIAPPAPPSAAPGLAPAPPAPPAPVNPALEAAISDVAVDGATAYPAGLLAADTAGLTGPAIPLARIEAARIKLLNRYRADGFVYTAVNARISGTHLRLVVIEGRIVSVKLSGDIGPAGTQVLGFLNHLTEISPVRNSDIERWLLLANDVPGVYVKSRINPSTSDPGALTLVAEVSRQAFSGSMHIDNRAFRETGPDEMLVQLDANSFSSLGERTEVSLYHTFNNTDTFGQASEEFYIGTSGLKMHVYGGAGEAIPSDLLRTVGYDGVTRVGGIDLSYPLIRSRQQTLTLTAAFDVVESDISYDSTGKPLRNSFDSLRVLRGQAQYVLQDNWFSTWAGPAVSAVNHASLRVSQGLPILGAEGNDNLQPARINERVDFTKVDAQFDRRQTVWMPYPGAALSILGAVGGQFSNNILPPEEKYYLGGPNFNRGYYYGEVTGDRALQMKIEPQFDLPLPTPAFSPFPLRAELYLFYDWGEVWQEQKLDLGHTLRSFGGGARFYADPNFEIDVEGVSRLTRTPDGAGVTPLRSTAIYWQFVARY